MWNSILLSILFFLVMSIERYVFSQLSAFFAFLPLAFMIGILLSQKVSATFGTVWFLALFLFSIIDPFSAHHPVSFLFVGALLPATLSKLFSNRSVYALIGTGSTLYFVFLFVDAMARYVLNGLGRSFSYDFSAYVNVHGLIFLFLPIIFMALYWFSHIISFIFSRYFYLRV